MLKCRRVFSITRQSDDELEGIRQGCYLSTAARQRAENVAAAKNAVLVQPAWLSV